MGLYICYELALPRDRQLTEVVERVRQLHRVAAGLPFEIVSPLVEIIADDTLGAFNLFDCTLEQFFRFCARNRLDARDESTGHRIDRLPYAVGFTVKPGRYCEAATFGLAWVPPQDEDGNCVRDQPSTWHWHAVCKTQYASVVSDEHLIRCHTAVVALLDEAIRLEFDVTVRDETHYWETRDPDRLVSEVHAMNKIVARIAGALHDAVGDSARTEGAIFKHREFEELESDP